MSKINPLQSFFRKPKFTVTLPSRGRWYPQNAIANANGTVEIYGMTAADSTRFRSAETFINLTAISDLIRSCVPAITSPEQMPIVDLDAIMLAIRSASISPTVTVTAPVPGTTLTHTETVDIQQLISQCPNASEIWDEKLAISNENNEQLNFVVTPINIKSMFGATRFVMRQQETASEISLSNRKNDEKIQDLDEQMKSLSNFAVTLVADSIREISTSDGTSVKNANDIKNFLNQIDLEYFRAIEAHINQQKKLVAFPSITVTATAEQQSAGAPEQWQMPLNFDINGFFE